MKKEEKKRQSISYQTTKKMTNDYDKEYSNENQLKWKQFYKKIIVGV